MVLEILVNESKIEIVHFRPKTVNQTTYNFTFSEKSLSISHKYKYLGLVLTEHLDFSRIATLLAGADGRVIGAVINKFQSLREYRFSTFDKSYNTHVKPILENS